MGLIGALKLPVRGLGKNSYRQAYMVSDRNATEIPNNGIFRRKETAILSLSLSLLNGLTGVLLTFIANEMGRVKFLKICFLYLCAELILQDAALCHERKRHRLPLAGFSCTAGIFERLTHLEPSICQRCRLPVGGDVRMRRLISFAVSFSFPYVARRRRWVWDTAGC